MHTNMNRVLLSIGISTLSAVAFGCTDDELPTGKGPVCQEPPCPDEDGNDEVGDGDGDNPDVADEPRFCSTNASQGERTTYQCNGHLTVSISFETLKGDCGETLGSDDWCTEDHEFGVMLDPYEIPAVMACCDAEGTPEDDLLRYCAMDLVEQVCISIPERLEAMIKQADLKGVVKNQAKNLLSWLYAHRQECYDTLHKPTDSPGIIMPVSWKVNGGDNKNWKLLKDFTITIDKAVVQSASLPENEKTYLGCSDDSLNDNEIFEERGPLMPVRGVDTYQLGDAATVPIAGPSTPDGERVWGMAEAVSQSLCDGLRCSSLAIGVADGVIVLEDLDIFGSGASIDVGEMQLDVDDLALRLYGAVQARPYHGNDGFESYIIDAGAAHFMVNGSIGALTGTRWVSNATSIVVHESDGGWTLEGFRLEHVDGLGGAWQAAIPLTTWN